MNINLQNQRAETPFLRLIHSLLLPSFLFIFQRHIVIFLFIVYTVYNC
mgnify:CR=1 FL=1